MIKTRRTKSHLFRSSLEAIEQVVKYQRDVREVALALSAGSLSFILVFTVAFITRR